MLSSPHSVLPARAHRLRRVALPITVVTAVVAGLVATVVSPSPASAAGAGTFTIGDAPIALNQPSDPEMGVLTPSADAAEDGMFGTLAPWPIIPLHATVARNGHLITFGTPINTVAQAGIVFDDWDGTAGLGIASHTDSAVMHGYDSFCNSAVTLADGRLLMVSGQIMDGRAADMMSMLYDPTSGAQTMGADLAYRRWYPTSLRLTDNRILLLGGGDAGNTSAYLDPADNSGVAFTPEIGTGIGGWTQLPGAASPALFGAEGNHWWYPRAFNGPNGTVVGFSGDRIWTLNPNGAGSVQQTGTLPFDPKVSGSQVMYAPGKILIAGGGQVNNDDPSTATNQAVILDVNGATPVATATSAMNSARNWGNLTVLPNGEVFANGGTIVGTNGGEANSVRKSEIYSPTAGGWRNAATAQVTRTYHSTSLLMPSGAVFTGGGGNPGPVDNFNGELYYPSYLFAKGANGTVKWASRPEITAISGSATYGGAVALKIGDGRAIASASLITLPSVTHSQNTDQRRIPLDITQNGGTVTASLPGSVNTMPPGDYELTVVDAKGVPSAAQILTIRVNDAGLVTVADAPEAPAADAAGGAGADAGAGNGAAVGAGAGAGAGAGVAAGAGAGPAKLKPVTLKKGTSVGLLSLARPGARVAHAKTKVSVKKAGATSSKTAKRSTSWIVRTGLGSKKGYSFESLDKPGYYLAAPAKGAGSLTLVKKSTSASIKKRTTFTSVKGVLGHDVSFHLTSTPTLYVRTDGTRLVVKKLSESSASLRASSFAVKKGLASKR